MVTGDRADAAETIAAALDLDAVLAEREPADKVNAVTTEQRQSPTVMVGDGINDAPALAAANVGIAMGARGASASSEAADVVILIDRLDRVSEAVSIARRTRAIALQSILAGMTLSGVAMGCGGSLASDCRGIDPRGDRCCGHPQCTAGINLSSPIRAPKNAGCGSYEAAAGSRADGNSA